MLPIDTASKVAESEPAKHEGISFLHAYLEVDSLTTLKTTGEPHLTYQDLNRIYNLALSRLTVLVRIPAVSYFKWVQWVDILRTLNIATAVLYYISFSSVKTETAAC